MIYETHSRVLVQIGPHVFPGTVTDRTFEQEPDYAIELDCGVRLSRGTKRVKIVRALEPNEGSPVVLGDEIGSAA